MPSNGLQIDAAAATSFPLPSDIDAERAVLGSMLHDRKCIPIVRQTLRLGGKAFSRERHRLLYDVLLRMDDAGEETGDSILLQAKLTGLGIYDIIGGIAYLGTLVTSVPSSLKAEHYAAIVQEQAVSRSFVQSVHASIMRAKHKDGGVRDWIAAAQADLTRLSEGLQRKTIDTLASAVMDLFPGDDLEAKPPKVQSQWSALDRVTGGWHGAELIIPAARPGVGKTSFLINLACHLMHIGSRSMFFSLEMSRDQLTHRFLSLLGNVPVRTLQTGQSNKQQRADLARARDTMKAHGAHILIDDDSSTTIEDIRARAAIQHAANPLSCVMVDYLQLVKPSGRYDRRDLEVASVARGLKALAKDLDVPVFAAAQVRREVEDAEKPKLRDLRESGDIESAADQVIFMLRTDPDPASMANDRDRGTMTMIIAKNRHGATGEVSLTWYPMNMEIRNEANAPAAQTWNVPPPPPAMEDWNF